MGTVRTRSLFGASLRAYVAFVGVFAAGVALAVLGRPRPVGVAVSRVVSGLALALGLGLFLLAGLLTVHRPVLMRLLRSGTLRSAVQSRLLGGLLAVVPFAATVFLLRDGESLTGLAAFWTRVPGELALNLAPYLVSGALFATDLRRLVQDEGCRRTTGCTWRCARRSLGKGEEDVAILGNLPE